MKKKLIVTLGLLLVTTAWAVDVKISQLPLGTATSTGSLDSLPYVSATTNVTKRVTLWDLSNIPTIVSTYAPKANPTFTGVVTAPSFVGPLTGNASTATALVANPTDCSSGQYANAIAANGNLTCAAVATSQLTGTLAVGSGGTGLATGTSGGLLAFTGSTTIASTAAGSAGQHLASAGTGSPVWTTATFPSTTTANQLLYSSATNTVGGLSTAGTGVLVTNSSGVPSIQACTTANRVLRTDGSALTCSQVAAATDVSGQLAIGNGGTGAATKAAGFDALSPMTTIGDIIYGGASGTGTRLAGGTTGQVLTAATGAAPSWTTLTAPNIGVAAKTSGYTVLSTDGLLTGDSTGGAFQFTLPAASSNSGKIYYFKRLNAGSNAITIARAGSDTIDGATSITLTVQYESTILISDGVSAWAIF